MGKYKYWEIDNTDILKEHIITATQAAITDDPISGFFKFAVSRHKDASTNLEHIKIIAEVQETKAGAITTDLISISNDIPKLRGYGVVLSRAKYVELGQIISANYYYFEPIPQDKINDIDDIFSLFCQYIADNNTALMKIKNEELYNVELSVFNKELADSQYRQYNTTDIKEALFNRGYTVANKGKFDYVVTVEEDGEKKKRKMVSFKRECVDAVNALAANVAATAQ